MDSDQPYRKVLLVSDPQDPFNDDKCPETLMRDLREGDLFRLREHPFEGSTVLLTDVVRGSVETGETVYRAEEDATPSKTYPGKYGVECTAVYIRTVNKVYAVEGTDLPV